MSLLSLRLFSDDIVNFWNSVGFGYDVVSHSWSLFIFVSSFVVLVLLLNFWFC